MIPYQKPWLVTFILVVILSLFLSACPAVNPVNTSTTTTTSSSIAVSPTVSTTTYGALHLYDTDPYTLDPATCSDATSAEFIQQIFSGLITLDANLNPVADIANSWTISDSGTIYTFILNKDVKFHDGKKVTASDFKYSWERACNPQTGSLTAATYLGDILGADEMLAGKTANIIGLKVVDNYTLQVTIDAPKSYFLYKLSNVTAFVIDKNNVTAGDWWHKPNGTGPFKLKEWVRNASLTLERNADFYGEKAKLMQINYQFLSGVPMRLYETGSIDVAEIGSDYIDTATDDTGPYLSQLNIYPVLSFQYIGFNCRKPPFDDPNIRRAFSITVDKTKLASLVFRDLVSPASGILPAGLPGYNTQLQGLDFNIIQARALIKASSYGDIANLPPITITTSGYGGSTSSDLEAIVYEWKQNLGVEVAIRQLEPQRFLYNLQDELDEMYYTGWVADYPHPQDFLEVLFKSNSQYNYGGYANDEADTLLKQAGLETNIQKSFTTYQQVEQIMVSDAACLPLWFGKSYILVKTNVKNYNPSAMGFLRLSQVYITK